MGALKIVGIDGAEVLGNGGLYAPLINEVCHAIKHNVLVDHVRGLHERAREHGFPVNQSYFPTDGCKVPQARSAAVAQAKAAQASEAGQQPPPMSPIKGSSPGRSCRSPLHDLLGLGTRGLPAQRAPLDRPRQQPSGCAAGASRTQRRRSRRWVWTDWSAPSRDARLSARAASKVNRPRRQVHDPFVRSGFLRGAPDTPASPPIQVLKPLFILCE
jgi:hypothetical protein